MPLLRGLGINGTGPAPAVLALALYSLLPLLRGFYTGFSEVATEVKDAAVAIGFGWRRLFIEVELPLALPTLISGLRVVTTPGDRLGKRRRLDRGRVLAHSSFKALDNMSSILSW